MTAFTSPLPKGGPVVRVRVGFSRGRELALRRAGSAVRSAIAVDALIDTGADVSMIEHGLLTPFVRDGMDLKGFVNINAPGLGGLAYAPMFLVGVRIEHPSGKSRDDLVVPAIEIVEHALGSPDCQFLIGRDILSRCIFHYDGPAGDFTLTY